MTEIPLWGGKSGEPVPEVLPADIKAAWETYRDVEGRQGGQRVAIGTDVFKHCCSEGANLGAVTYRATFLQFMVRHAPEMLAEDGQPNEAAFRVIAQIPMEWMGQEVRHGLPFDADELLRRVREERKAG